MDIRKHLICPDCQSKLDVNDGLICRICGRIFYEREGIFILLPSEVSAVDLSEERFWNTDSKEGVRVHPSLALLAKNGDIRFFYERILPELKLEGNVLEIGSGSCWLSSLVKFFFPNIFIVATDVAFSALCKGQQVSNFLKTKIDSLIACKAERIPFEGGFFDFVLGSAVLHHTNAHEALNQVFRVLKEGGLFIGLGEPSIPKMLKPLWSSRFIAGWREKKLGVKEGSYSFSEWEKLFHESGFGDVQFKLRMEPKYREGSCLINLYYYAISFLPKSVVIRLLPCIIQVTARKPIEIDTKKIG